MTQKEKNEMLSYLEDAYGHFDARAKHPGPIHARIRTLIQDTPTSRVRKYHVFLLSPYCEWECVEAESAQKAIDQCDYPPEFDMSIQSKFIAIELDEDCVIF